MKIVASFDDGTSEDVRVADLVARYEIPTIFYWPADLRACNDPKGRISLTEAEADDIASEFEIGSHTITHPLLTRIPLDEAKKEIVSSRSILRAKFGQEIESFCYPRGYYNNAMISLVFDAGYKAARTTEVGELVPALDPLRTATTVHVGYNRKEYKAASWQQFARAAIRIGLDMERELRVKGKEPVYHLWGHSWEIDQNDAWGDLETLLQELSRVSVG